MRSEERKFDTSVVYTAQKRALSITKLPHVKVKTDAGKIHHLDRQLHVDIASSCLADHPHRPHPDLLRPRNPNTSEDICATATVPPRDPTPPRKPLRGTLDKLPPSMCGIQAHRHPCSRPRPRGTRVVHVRGDIDREPFVRTEDTRDGVHEDVADIGWDDLLVGYWEAVVLCNDGVQWIHLA